MSLFLKKSFLELKADIHDGALDSKDLIKETLKLIEKDNDPFKAFVNWDPNRVEQNASPGILQGFPIGIKDIFNTKNFGTEMGSAIWKGFTPGNDARVVSNLLNHGVVVAGKTVTAEFAVHELNTTLNPYDITKTPGTSSSGSAVAVSMGYVPIALGTQTAGSIIRPASFCGVIGFKPSFGLLPRTGVLKTTDSLDSIGFLTTHLDYLLPVLDSARVRGKDYPNVYKYVDSAIERKGKQIKIGFVKTHVWDFSEIYVKKSIQEVIDKVKEGNDFEISEIKWPSDLDDTHFVHEQIYTKSLSYYFNKEYKQDPENISSIMKEMIKKGEKITFSEFQRCLQRQQEIANKVNDIFRPYDCVITNSTGSSAPKRGDVEINDPSLIWTMCHLPALSVPLFKCPQDLPFGLQLVSKRWGDYQLCKIAPILVEKFLN